MAKVKSLDVLDSGTAPDGAVYALAGVGEAGVGEGGEDEASVVEVFVSLKGHIDLDLEMERLTKSLEKARAERSAIEKKLANDSFVSKAPPEVVEKERTRLGAAAEKIEKLETGLARIRKIGE